MIMIELDRDSSVPLYLQIRNRLSFLVRSGALAEGTQLPPERRLAANLGVTRGTVTNAYRELVAAGLAEARVGRGTIVRQSRERAAMGTPTRAPSWPALFAPQPRRLQDPLLQDVARLVARPDVIAFTAGVPAPELYPQADFHQTIDRLLREGDPRLLGPCAAEGFRSLRQAIASHMTRQGTGVAWEQVLVTTGAQEGLDLLTRAFLEPGDAVIIEEPTYLGALQSFGSAGVRLLSVPLDNGGLCLDILESLLARHPPKLIYTLPTFQNPSGVSQDLERRLGLLALAARYGVPVVEDDPYGPLYFEEPPPPTLRSLDQHEIVIYVSTFSKIMFPGLRLGWIAAPGQVIERLARIKQRGGLYANVLAQWATTAFIEAGHLEQHLARVRQAYLQRRNAMATALAEHCPDLGFSVPAGGFNLWCRLPEGLKARDLLIEAGLRGTVFAPGELFYPREGGVDALRLNFSSQTEQQICEGVSRLGQALAALEAQAVEVSESEQLTELLV
jgi:DNA-binding transcriptional MocR family regulator